MKSIKNYYLVLLATILIFSLDISDSMFAYYVFFIILLIFIIKLIYEPKIKKIQTIDFIPIGMVLLWFYGFFVGILNDNNVEYAIRNFAGLLIYVLYFVIISSKIKNNELIKLLLVVSFINVFVGLYYALNAGINDNLIYMDSGQARLFFLGNMTTYYIINSWSVFNLLAPTFVFNQYQTRWFMNNNIFNLLLFIFSSLAIILPASKGFILGYIIILLSVIIILFRKYLKSWLIMNKKFLFTILILLIILIFFILTGYINLILSIFDTNESSNAVRTQQFYLLLSDLSFFGKGLGATVLGNNTENTYGFELVYINIFHKFGIFALFVYVSLFVTIYFIFKIVINFNNTLIGIICLSSMGYLIPSLGNPMLFAPINIVLHVVVLIIIRNILFNRKDENV